MVVDDAVVPQGWVMLKMRGEGERGTPAKAEEGQVMRGGRERQQQRGRS